MLIFIKGEFAQKPEDGNVTCDPPMRWIWILRWESVWRALMSLLVCQMLQAPKNNKESQFLLSILSRVWCKEHLFIVDFVIVWLIKVSIYTLYKTFASDWLKFILYILVQFKYFHLTRVIAPSLVPSQFGLPKHQQHERVLWELFVQLASYSDDTLSACRGWVAATSSLSPSFFSSSSFSSLSSSFSSLSSFPDVLLHLHDHHR